MSDPKPKCIGFPVGSPCENEAGNREAPAMCDACNEKRAQDLAEVKARMTREHIAHLTRRR